MSERSFGLWRVKGDFVWHQKSEVLIHHNLGQGKVYEVSSLENREREKESPKGLIGFRRDSSKVDSLIVELKKNVLSPQKFVSITKR